MTLNVNHDIEKHCRIGKKITSSWLQKDVFIARNINFEFWVYSNIVTYSSMDNGTGLLSWYFLGISGRWPKCPFRTFFPTKMQHYNTVTSCYVLILRFWWNLNCQSRIRASWRELHWELQLWAPFLCHRNWYSWHCRNEWHRLLGFVHLTQNRSWATWILFLLFSLIVVTFNRTHWFLLCLIFGADKRG